MDKKYPLTCLGVLDQDTQKWYESEQCWNCEPEELLRMQIRKNKPIKIRATKKYYF